jgi:Immunity protein 17
VNHIKDWFFGLLFLGIGMSWLTASIRNWEWISRRNQIFGLDHKGMRIYFGVIGGICVLAGCLILLGRMLSTG